MYEFKVAAKYLMPRWKQLSVSIISLVSVLVIAAVVWLIVVFFSVTAGLTNSWVDKLIALTAPVRVTPTPYYHQSFYYLVDGISSASDYTLKTIGEKRNASISNPYDPDYDEEPPLTWKKPDYLPDGSLRDPVQGAFAAIQSIQNIPGLTANDYEMTVGNLHLQLLRQNPNNRSFAGEYERNSLTQSSYLGSFDPQNPKLLQALATTSAADLTNLLTVLSLRSDTAFEDGSSDMQLDDPAVVQQRLKTFFSNVNIETLQTPQGGWLLPRHLLPAHALWDVTLVKKDHLLDRVYIGAQKKLTKTITNRSPVNGYSSESGQLLIENGTLTLIDHSGTRLSLPPHAKLYLEQGITLPAKLLPDSLSQAHDASSVRFMTKFSIQGTPLNGEIAYGNLIIEKATPTTLFSKTPAEPPLWMYGITTPQASELKLPSMNGFGDGVLLPKSFRTTGILLGDRGYLSYLAPTPSSVQEQRIPIFVAGFYDPGIIPIGGKYVLTSKEITSLIRSFANHEDATFSNGINVRFNNTDDADAVKQQLEKAFQASGIAPYWKVETYKEYEFTKDILQQLQSEKRLFTLLATLIILVACSNIISMLIILVNDKKLEIGILRSMGASSLSIACIFGTCGIVMGAVGSLIGIAMATITLHNIQPLVDFIGRIQGYEMFNPVFYGETLPSEISMEALSFVVLATAAISLLAGVIPAIKACLIKPAAILKAE